MQVIIYTNENGNVSVCYPSNEFPIEEVKAKDTPEHSIIIDQSELPQGEDEFFDAWELVDGKVIVNQTKKQAIIDAQQIAINSKQFALNKLIALGLTEQEALALGNK